MTASSTRYDLKESAGRMLAYAMVRAGDDPIGDVARAWQAGDYQAAFTRGQQAIAEREEQLQGIDPEIAATLDNDMANLYFGRAGSRYFLVMDRLTAHGAAEVYPGSLSEADRRELDLAIRDLDRASSYPAECFENMNHDIRPDIAEMRGWINKYRFADRPAAAPRKVAVWSCLLLFALLQLVWVRAGPYAPASWATVRMLSSLGVFAIYLAAIALAGGERYMTIPMIVTVGIAFQVVHVIALRFAGLPFSFWATVWEIGRFVVLARVTRQLIGGNLAKMDARKGLIVAGITLALTLAQWYILMPSYARDTAPSTFWRVLPFWLLEAALAWAACMATPHIQQRIKNW